jgi:hypothetical protein
VRISSPPPLQNGNGHTLGSVHPPTSKKQREVLAKRSLASCCSDKKTGKIFCELFPHHAERNETEQAAAAAAAAEAAAAGPGGDGSAANSAGAAAGGAARVDGAGAGVAQRPAQVTTVRLAITVALIAIVWWWCTQ